MKAVIRWTMYARRMSTLWWSIGITSLVVLTLALYPSFRDDSEELQQSFDGLSDTALQFLGGSSDFFSPIGFTNSQVYFIVLPLLFGILAIGLGSSLLAKEEQDATIESLLSHPLSRGSLLFAKLFSGLAIFTAVTLIAHIGIISVAAAVDLGVSTSALTQTTFVCYLLCISFGMVAFLFAATGRAKGASIGVATVVAFGGYIIDSLAGSVEWLSSFSKSFPFHYYQSEAILSGNYNWSNLWYFVSLIAVCTLLSWIVFRRRDLA